MMAQALVGRTTRAAIVCALAIAALLLATGAPKHAASFLAGTLLGLVPIVTWRLLAAALFEERGLPRGRSPQATESRGVLLAVAVSLAKVIFYITALYVLVPRLDVLPLGAGVLLPSTLMAAIALRTPAEVRA